LGRGSVMGLVSMPLALHTLKIIIDLHKWHSLTGLSGQGEEENLKCIPSFFMMTS